MGTNQPPYSDLTSFVNQTSQNQTRILSSSISSSPSSSTTVFENVHYIPHVSSLLQSPLPPSTPRQQLIVGSQTLVQSSPQHFTRFPSTVVASASTPMQMPLNVSPQRIRAVLPPASRPTLTSSISLPPTPIVRQIPPNGKTRDEFYKRKHHLLKKCIKSLVFKNAALSDEVARLHHRINTVTEERKVLLRKLLTHEKRRASAAQKKANKHNQTQKKVETSQENLTITPT